MSQSDLDHRIIRYGELIPCKTAFIDAHTPGSDQKENFSIIGAGVSEAADQHVHLTIPHGFNIGAAGQPPRCFNSLHAHRTAEVFFVLSGRWRFFWGRHGDAGEVILEEGDIINIPTGLFRGFENVGSDYAMIMAILGGDDAGGGVVWAPEVIMEAKMHGLLLSQTGRLYDTKKGENLLSGEAEMPLLGEEELASFTEPSSMMMVGGYVRRYRDLEAISDKKPITVIGERGVIRDKPGFEVIFTSRKSASTNFQHHDKPSVLMPAKGAWRITWADGETVLNPGDTMSIPVDLPHAFVPAMSGEAALYQVVATNDPAGPTWKSN